MKTPALIGIATVLGGLSLSLVAAFAQTLEMPALATLTGTRDDAAGTLHLPTGPFAGGKMPLREVAGAVAQRAYRIGAPNLATLQIVTPLLLQLKTAGYQTIFQCDTTACGGFDFRYGMDVLPEPQMHVDLGDFRYVLTEKPDGVGMDSVALLVSRSADAGFVQVTTVAPPGSEAKPDPMVKPGPESKPGPETKPEPDSKPGPDTKPDAETKSDPTGAADVPSPLTQPANPPADFGSVLMASGFVALDDLVFPSGSSALEVGDYASLASLAAWLKVNPSRHVVLVGHTDAIGSLPANTALSRQRALSVRTTMIAKLKADPAQIDAKGAGPLAPRATNETPEGRAQNRRVEVMLTPPP